VTLVITGAAGNVGYALAHRVASGEMLGHGTLIQLHLLTTARSRPATEALALELEDCASPCLLGVEVFEDANDAFRGVHIALLLASARPTPGSRRAELLRLNAAIVRTHARALNESAATGVRVLVVSNPSNTMTLIAIDEARDTPPRQFSGLSRLDHDRAVSLIARHHGTTTDAVTRMSIWGNHSDTQVPDASQLLIDGRRDTIDSPWLDTSLPQLVIGRGQVVRDKRSTAVGSTANAAVNHIKNWVNGTPAADWTSAAIASDGSYGVPDGLVSSFPVVSDGNDWAIVQGLRLPAGVRGHLDASIAELLAERRHAHNLLAAHQEP
jgi:malate dehydrogenase